jgi:hypothetical protein
MNSTKHHCHARGCARSCKPEFLMCPTHWAMVPASLQREVYRHYRRGQCDDKQPSREWFIAAERAIVAVAVKEGIATSDGAAEYLAKYIEGLPTLVLVKSSIGPLFEPTNAGRVDAH